MFLTPWEEYLSNKDLPRMKYLCQCSDRMIEEFCFNHNYSGTSPKICIDASEDFKPYSTEYAQIVLPHGFFDWLENLIHSLPEQITPHVTKKNAALMMTFWVVAHEYSHIARSHFEVMKNNKELVEALEYDADMFATANVLRHTQHIYTLRQASISAIEAKTYLLVCVFFYLRQLMEVDEIQYEKRHKPFHIRLFWIIEKLAWMDNFDPETGQTTQGFNDEIKILMDSLISSEKAFLKHNKIEHSRLIDLFSNSEKTVKPYADEVSKKWNEAAPLVNKFQLIKAST